MENKFFTFNKISWFICYYLLISGILGNWVFFKSQFGSEDAPLREYVTSDRY